MKVRMLIFILSVYFAVLFFGNIVFGAANYNPLINFKEALDAYDNKIYSRTINQEDVDYWWKLADGLVIQIYNNHIDGNGRAIGSLTVGKNSGLKIGTRSVGKNHLEFYYSESRPPEGAAQNFSIVTIPLDSNFHTFFVQYRHLWYEQPDLSGQIAVIGTFHIMSLNPKTGKYVISAKQETSNLLQELKAKKKTEFWPPWQKHPLMSSFRVTGGVLVTESIKNDKDRITFSTIWGRCETGMSCNDDMTIFWSYSNGKLKANGYIDKYEDANQSTQIDKADFKQ